MIRAHFAALRQEKSYVVRRYCQRQAAKYFGKMLLLLAAGGFIAAAAIRWYPAWLGYPEEEPDVQLHTRRPATRHIIAIDSGHGGSDTGAQGIVAETAVTQKTAQLLEEYLQHDPSYTPVQIHTPEESPSPQQRAELAGQNNAELFISLHANKDTSASSNGFECYAIPPGHSYHAESLEFSRLVVQQMSAAGARIRGEEGVRYAYYKNGKKLMKEASCDRKYTYPTFGVLQDAACPAVLVEQCFISNAEDYASWGNEQGCIAAAVCYYRAICAFFDTTPVGNMLYNA